MTNTEGQSLRDKVENAIQARIDATTAATATDLIQIAEHIDRAAEAIRWSVERIEAQRWAEARRRRWLILITILALILGELVGLTMGAATATALAARRPVIEVYRLMFPSARP